MRHFLPIKSWLLHFLYEIDEYSVHSPFLYDFYIQCIKKAGADSISDKIERLREMSGHDNTKITTGIFGSDAGINKPSAIPVGKIAKNGITARKYSLLLREMIRYFKYDPVVELGTSIGINTLYLSDAGNNRVYTFEGNDALSNYAAEIFNEAGTTDIIQIRGNIDETLPRFATQNISPGLVYFDANHLYEPTLKYFSILNGIRKKNAAFVLDDIHWSAGMIKAWNEIRNHADVRIDIDFFQLGILFFKPELPRLSVRFSL